MIKPLAADNYSTWSADIKMLLIEKGCWSIVTGTEKPPGENADSITVRDYKLREGKALSTIYLNTSPKFRTLLEACQNGPDAWAKLKEYFRPDSRARIMALKQEFFELIY